MPKVNEIFVSFKTASRKASTSTLAHFSSLVTLDHSKVVLLAMARPRLSDLPQRTRFLTSKQRHA
jgi:hypothetical protein